MNKQTEDLKTIHLSASFHTSMQSRILHKIMILKILQNSQETLVPDSLDSDIGVFLIIFRNLRTPFLQNTSNDFRVYQNSWPPAPWAPILSFT